MKTDDPQFTAHALGELDTLTPAERAEIEALLRDDPSAEAESAETRKIAEVLRRDLQGEEMPPLISAGLNQPHSHASQQTPPRTPGTVTMPGSRNGSVISNVFAPTAPP